MSTRNLRTWCREFLLDESGPTATEYAVLLALVLAVVIGSVAVFGNSLNTSFEDSNSQMFP